MYDDETLGAVRAQLERVAAYDFYGAKFDKAGIDPAAIDSWEDFRDVPFTTADELEADFEANPPEGSCYPGESMICFTPMGDDLKPVFDTQPDLEHMAAVNATVFERAGIRRGDRVLNTFGYHLFGTGLLIHRGLEQLGAEVIPLGPGDSEQAASVIDEFDVDALIGNPSYALKIGAAGGHVNRFVGAGEPFTSIPGLREEVKEALGCETACDYFGSRQILPVAAETTAEDGLYVTTDYALVEVVDPDTGEVVGPGNRGELVVTHVKKEGAPLVRYRTGDLADVGVRDGRVVLPNGVIGRTDGRLKVKGVKLYPEAVGLVLAGFDGLTGNYRLTVSRPDATDHLAIVCEGRQTARNCGTPSQSVCSSNRTRSNSSQNSKTVPRSWTNATERPSTPRTVRPSRYPFIVRPPDTESTCPVTNPASSEAK
ncbi:phenylacetate--CoA ligase family protein [Haladaptatus sp. GCM10025893]|uniref:phenylacetate--CoA ligase family protein n=1 Tax=Haladaptatus sp. GCM10025893 TaxID=3252659 RepID=UPI00361ED324